MALRCRILDKDGTEHVIEVNGYEDYSITVGGWDEVASYYNLPKDVVICLGYYGNKIFEIAGVIGIESSAALPSFHSRFIDRNGIHMFNVKLSSSMVSSCILIES